MTADHAPEGLSAEERMLHTRGETLALLDSLAALRAERDALRERVEAVEALDAERIADSLNSRWGTDHVHRMVARHVIELVHAILHPDPSEESTDA